MTLGVRTHRLVIMRKALPRAKSGHIGIGDDYGASQDNAAIAAGQTLPDTPAPSSSAWNWDAIANITGAVAKLGGAGASAYIAHQNTKTANANASLQSRLTTNPFTGGSMPSWTIPAAIGGLALVVVLAMSGGKTVYITGSPK